MTSDIFTLVFYFLCSKRSRDSYCVSSFRAPGPLLLSFNLIFGSQVFIEMDSYREHGSSRFQDAHLEVDRLKQFLATLYQSVDEGAEGQKAVRDAIIQLVVPNIFLPFSKPYMRA